MITPVFDWKASTRTGNRNPIRGYLTLVTKQGQAPNPCHSALFYALPRRRPDLPRYPPYETRFRFGRKVETLT